MTRTTYHFPELRIVHLNSLRLHEHVDAARMQPLAVALAEQGVLKNPPAVLPLDNGGGEYVALDGANHTLALRSLGLS